MKKILISVGLLIAISMVGLLVILNNRQPEKAVQKSEQPAESKLTIISTKPDPLGGAYIGFTQPVDITFNKPISKSELKYKIEPEIEHTFEATDTGNKDFGATYQLKFSKPLKSGEGFSLTINGETKTNEGEKLDKEYNFVVKTIVHKGV
jgi:hypothetical protein